MAESNDSPTRLPSSTWTGPEDYGGSKLEFMRQETKRVCYSNDYRSQGIYYGDDSVYRYIHFDKTVGSIAVAGLHGCSTLIVVSQLCAWVNHMWQVPEFECPPDAEPQPTEQQQLDYFKGSVVDPLRHGDGHRYPFGLLELRNGFSSFDTTQIHELSDEAKPHVFLFAPYEEVVGEDDPNRHAEFPVGLRIRYEEHNRMIEAEVRNIFGQAVPFQVVPYNPRVCPTEMMWAREVSTLPSNSKSYFETILNSGVLQANFNSHRGKVLVQYRPASGPRGKAGWRVWFKGHGLPSGGDHQEWEPMAPYQIAYSEDAASNPGGTSTIPKAHS
ncbi:hypothetical protein Hte_009219 [Hypoxylon texense]